MNVNKWLLMFALTWMHPALEDVLAHTDPLKPARKVMEQIDAASGGTMRVEWNEKTKTPAIWSGQLTKPSNHTPEWISFEFLKKVKSVYGLKRVDENMKVTYVDRDRSDKTIVVMQRQLYGKPVCGDGLIVEMDKSGVIRRVEGTVHAGLEQKRLNRPMYPAVSGDEAAAVASRYVHGLYRAEEATVHACYLPNREGVPLIYVVSFNRTADGGPASLIRVHSLTGRVIE
ncbi:hypothetical protein FE783_24550 [Paenibacillus mesophilus]|uniref:hypothetical protein n=1 Tax=Paenibacillus mesophilus TaxID=2582849 RepID=UPI00110D531A|nr:hypothetical protein [Paenibacillus mesophilus]TMV46814.1 hypothetical protein FE783_24550 [Paenibacillus mesophilus]